MPSSEIVFVGAFAVYVAIRAHFERRAGASPPTVAPHAQAERILLGTMTIGAVVLPMAYLTTPWLAVFDYRLPLAVTVIGAAAAGLALWLFWHAHADLDTNWSRTMSLTAEQQLVTHGVYQYVRHPMYAAIWLFGLGQACLLHNAVAGWSALVAFAPMYGFRVSREEQMMLERFGVAYTEYCGTSGRLWPRWRGRSSTRPAARRCRADGRAVARRVVERPCRAHSVSVGPSDPARPMGARHVAIGRDRANDAGAQRCLSAGFSSSKGLHHVQPPTTRCGAHPPLA